MLSTTAEHAVRALLCLARGPKDQPLLARELSDCALVPMSYLSKILATLTRHGILNAARGVNGGYRLVRRPDDLALAEVVELFDGPQSDGVCFLGREQSCSDTDPCPAHAAWKAARDSYLAFLRNTTLTDLTGPLSWQTPQHRRQGDER